MTGGAAATVPSIPSRVCVETVLGRRKLIGLCYQRVCATKEQVAAKVKVGTETTSSNEGVDLAPLLDRSYNRPYRAIT